MFRLLFVAGQAFMVWMLVDAVRRRAEYYWFFVIFLPFGEWIYFFMVKIHDPEYRRLRELLRPKERVSIPKARTLYETSPSAVNQLVLARALYDAGRFDEAQEHFGALLGRSPEDRDALYGRALCRLGKGEKVAAIRDLAELIALEPAYEDYAPWTLLVSLLWQEEQRDAALTTLSELYKEAPRLGHAVLWAQHLAAVGETDQARTLLAGGVRDFDVAPRYVKRRDWRDAREAKRMLRALASLPPAVTAPS